MEEEATEAKVPRAHQSHNVAFFRKNKMLFMVLKCELLLLFYLSGNLLIPPNHLKM